MALYTKYGIPMDGLTPRDRAVQPRLRFKYRVRFVNFGGLESASYSFDTTQQAISITRPKISFEYTELGTYAGSVKVFNRPKFDAITLTLRDDMANHLSEALASQLQKQYDFNEGRYAVSSGSAKFTMIIESLDGTNEIRSLDAFRLEGCFIENCDFGNFDYRDGGINECTASIVYDYMGGYYSETNGIENAKELLWYVTSNATTMATSPQLVTPTTEAGALTRLSEAAGNSIRTGVDTITERTRGFFNRD